MKKLIFSFLFFFFFFYSNTTYSTINNKILVKIDDKIISSYELKNKILTLLFLSNQELNQKNINRSKSFAMKDLINLKIKKSELSKYNIDIDQGNVLSRLQAISSNNIENFKGQFIKNNINFKLFKEEIITELKWQKLIYSIYKDKVTINDDQINDELEIILKENLEIEEIKISEIVILLDDNKSFQEVVEYIKAQIKEFGFKQTALNHSTSDTAKDYGNLGWVNTKSLKKENYQVLSKMKVGEVSEPIKISNSINFYKILDKKKTKSNNINKEKIKNNLINSRKNELFNLYSNSHLSKLRNTATIEYK